MTNLNHKWVKYVGEIFGWHVCDIYDGDDWICQLRFNPHLHKFHRFSAPDRRLPDELEALTDYDSWRAFVKERIVARS